MASGALVAALGTATPAAAHQGNPNVHTVIDAIAPGLPGVTIEVRSGVADELLVVNDTDIVVEVLDTHGLPFLRIGKHTVEANYASADWYLSNSPLGLAATPAPGKQQDWRVVARGGAWGWFDHRMHDRARPLTPELLKTRGTVRLADWTIPMRYGGHLVTVTGHVEYRPLLGSFHSAVEHAPPGLTAQVLDGRVPGVFVVASGSATYVLEGSAGEAFARLGANGVQVNESSETWQEDRRLRGLPGGSRPADPATAHWRSVPGGRQLTWLDRRLAYAPGVPPADVLRADHPTTLVEWSIPVSYGTTHDAIRGTTTWLPDTLGTKRRNPVPFVIAAVALLAVLTAIQRRVARR